jgi:hypothetical protein
MATRFDLDNLLCLCAGCHLWWHKWPVEVGRWMEEKWPGRYDRLNQKRQLVTKIDVSGMYLYLQKEKEKIEAEPTF